MHALRNLGRRKVRTTLTIIGITIGIWALVVFGSMANKIGALVEGGSTYYADKITLSDASGSLGGFASAPDVARDRRPRAGRRRRGRGRARRDAAHGRRGERRHHGRAADDHRQRRGRGRGARDVRIHYAEGRALTAADEGTNVTVLGSDIARKYDKHVGDTIDPQGRVLHRRRGPGADAHGTRPGGHGAHGRGPAAARRRRCPRCSGRGSTPSDLATTMVVYPTPGRGRRGPGRPHRGAGAGRGHHDRRGLRPPDRLGHLASSTRSSSASRSSASSSAACRSSTRWPCRSPSGRARSASSAPSAAAGPRIVRELVFESALIGFIGGRGRARPGRRRRDLRERGRSVVGHRPVRAHARAPPSRPSRSARSSVHSAGFVPALHAARLDPVTALRYE